MVLNGFNAALKMIAADKESKEIVQLVLNAFSYDLDEYVNDISKCLKNEDEVDLERKDIEINNVAYSMEYIANQGLRIDFENEDTFYREGYTVVLPDDLLINTKAKSLEDGKSCGLIKVMKEVAGDNKNISFDLHKNNNKVAVKLQSQKESKILITDLREFVSKASAQTL